MSAQAPPAAASRTRCSKLATIAAYAKQELRDMLIEHKEYICRYGQDLPEIREWTWGG